MKGAQVGILDLRPSIYTKGEDRWFYVDTTTVKPSYPPKTVKKSFGDKKLADMKKEVASWG